MAWGVVMLHADEVPHRRRCCQVLALSQSPFSSLSPWPPPAPGTPLGPALYNPRGALQPGIQHQAPRHFSCTCSHIVGYTLIHKPINNRHTQVQPKKLWEMGLYLHHSLWAQQAWTKTLANNHTLTHSRSHMPVSQRPPTIPHKTMRWHPQDLLPSFCHLRTSNPTVSMLQINTTTKCSLPLEEVSSAAPVKLVTPGWRNEGQLGRSLMRQIIFY